MDEGNMHRDGELVDAPMAEAQNAAPPSGGQSTQTLEDITLAMLDQLGAAGASELQKHSDIQMYRALLMYCTLLLHVRTPTHLRDAAVAPSSTSL